MHAPSLKQHLNETEAEFSFQVIEIQNNLFYHKNIDVSLSEIFSCLWDLNNDGELLFSNLIDEKNWNQI